jgi:hypothetical protein
LTSIVAVAWRLSYESVTNWLARKVSSGLSERHRTFNIRAASIGAMPATGIASVGYVQAEAGEL